MEWLPSSHSDNAIPKLVLAASCAILLTLCAGGLLDFRINNLIETQDWSEHSLEVQSILQIMQVRLDRFNAIAHLYLVDHAPSTLRETQNLSVVIESSARHVGTLVSDNRTQDDNVQRLSRCASNLIESARSLDGSTPARLTDTQLSCREIISLMQEQERVLADSRSKKVVSSKVSLLAVGLSLACFSILVVIVLFGVLVRDALFRRLAQQQAASINEQLAASNSRLATTIQAMEDRAREMKLLDAARDQLQMCASAKDAHEMTSHFVSTLLPTSMGALSMINNSRQMIELRSSWGSVSSIAESFPLDGCCGMRSGHARWRNPESSVLHCEHFAGPPPERYVCLPLVAHGDTLGVLYIECASAEVVEAVERQLTPLRDLLQLASMTVAAINLRSKLENQSIRDSLTGLFNRHFMEITLEREIRRATRRKSSMAIFMLDADNFKQFNDTFGHKAGDTILRAIADRFLSSVRSEDIVCRYGGEEFVIILPDIFAEKAAERAQEIRQAIGDLRVSDQGQTLGPVTVSIGVAMYPDDGRTIEDLLQASDRSLYAAKKNGRNQVAFAAQAAGLPIGPK